MFNSALSQLTRLPAWPDVEGAVEQLISARRSENTRAAYRADWEKWRDFCLREAVDMKIPGLAACTEFRDRLVRNFAPASVSRILASLSFFYSALQAAGMVRTNPFARAWLPRPPTSDQHKTAAVEASAVERLLTAIAADSSALGKRDTAVVRILYDTGLRRASVATLRRDQLRVENGATVVSTIVKGGKQRFVKLTPEANAALYAWLLVAPPSPWVFAQRSDAKKHISLNTVNKIITDRAQEAGIRGLHPHCFRAAFITAAYDAKLYERDIQAAAHHANSATTRGYDRGARGDEVVDRVAEHRRQQIRRTK